MKLSDTATKQGIFQRIEIFTEFGYGGITSSTVLSLMFLGLVNDRKSRYFSIALKGSNGWLVDDSLYSDLPISDTDLVVGDSDYFLPESNYIIINRVEVKDNNDNWIRLKPLNVLSVKGSLEELRNQTGTPKHYIQADNVTKIFPIPDYSKAKGIKWYANRSSKKFVIEDLTNGSTTGLLEDYEIYLAIGASIDYMSIHQADSPKLKGLYKREMELEKDILYHYANRLQDELPRTLNIPIINAR